MADPRFFGVAGPFTLGYLAELTESELSDPVAAHVPVLDVAPLQEADGVKISFFDNRKYLETFKATKARACFVRPELAECAPAGTVCLKNRNPYKAYALAAQAFYPEEPVRAVRADSAEIDPSAVIGKDCSIGPGVVIGKNAKIGDRCRLRAHAVIEGGVEIGADGDIGAHVYITHALIGARVRIHAGACIGRPGFGFAMDQAGFVSVPQLGRVIIGDDVEIGANTAIDRGAGPDTVIGRGARIDNLVQIGHNVRIGEYCVIVAQTGISGSTQLGDRVMTGGQSGFAGHLSVGAGARIAAQSGVIRDVPGNMEVMGTPAVPIRKFMRQAAILSRLSAGKRSDET